MGWFFAPQTRAQLIHELIQPQETDHSRSEVIAHTVVDDVLWSVVHVTAKVSGFMNLQVGESSAYIRCDLLQCSDGQWGHKPLCESMHPYYYTCPLPYLDLAPVQCSEWRRYVMAYHQGQLSRSMH